MKTAQQSCCAVLPLYGAERFTFGSPLARPKRGRDSAVLPDSDNRACLRILGLPDRLGDIAPPIA